VVYFIRVTYQLNLHSQSELEHAVAKLRYRRGNKTKTATKQMTTRETIETRVRKIGASVDRIRCCERRRQEIQPLWVSELSLRYQMAQKPRRKFALPNFINEHRDDPAMKVLKLIPRVANEPLTSEFLSAFLGAPYGLPSGLSSWLDV
jgi:hypothetical protein